MRGRRFLGMRGERDTRGVDEDAGEFDMEELREFLEGDAGEPPADPEFRERLRRRLWRMVRIRCRGPPSWDAWRSGGLPTLGRAAGGGARGAARWGGVGRAGRCSGGRSRG